MSAVVKSIEVPLAFCLCSFVAGPAGCSTAIGAQSSHAGKIEIRVYDYVSLTSKTLNEAETEASRVLQQAGIETDWRLAALSAAEADGLAAAPPMQPTTVVLRILDRQRSEKLIVRKEALGYGVPCPVDEPGCMTSILYTRVEALAKQGDASLAQILGHAIAHELGHLLLGSNAHSISGIMQARSRGDVLRQATKGLLLFTTEQAGRMRNEVVIRQQRCLLPH